VNFFCFGSEMPLGRGAEGKSANEEIENEKPLEKVEEEKLMISRDFLIEVSSFID
jgi:hypothetical protein